MANYLRENTSDFFKKVYKGASARAAPVGHLNTVTSVLHGCFTHVVLDVFFSLITAPCLDDGFQVRSHLKADKPRSFHTSGAVSKISAESGHKPHNCVSYMILYLAG